MLLHPLLIVDFGPILSVTRTKKVDVRPHQLRGIFVRRRAEHLEAFCRGLCRERSHHVVGLETVLANHGDAESFGKLKGIGDVRRQILRHLLPLSLVGGEGLMTEGRPS